MKTFLLLMLMSAWPCPAQEVTFGPQQPSTDPRQQVPAPRPDPQPDPTITIPAGTRVELALANPIRRRDARVGDAVRAVTSFPVTVGQDLAIPQGSFVEGRIVKVGKHGSTRFDGLQIEFKQLVLSNGYNVSLDSSVVNAKAIAPFGDPGHAAAATSGFMANSFQQQPPQPPSPPQVGPPKGPIIAATLGGTVALVVVGILGHRHPPYFDQGRDFDTGFQFEIVLQAPLMLDRARVAEAVGGSGGN